MKTPIKHALAVLALAGWATAAGPTLLNVSYDVAREFYKEINPAFQKQENHRQRCQD